MKKLVAMLLCLATILSILPISDVSLLGTEGTPTTSEYTNYGAAIGGTARFNVEDLIGFLVFADPKTFDYSADWDNDENWLYYDEVGEVYDFEANVLFCIEGYYYDEETTALWYKLRPAPGHEMPERMKDACWAFQNYTEEYEYDDWETYAPNALLVDIVGSNFILDAEGNPVTEVEIGLYDTFVMTCETSLLSDIQYQWQILVGDEWVDILGEDTPSLPVTYSLLASAMPNASSAQLRCVTRMGSKTVVGDSITVSVDMDFDYDSYVHPAPEPEPASVSLLRTASLRRAANSDVMLLASDEVCYVTVQYLFTNGIQAANSSVAEVPKGVVLTEDVPINFPYVQGYLPYYEGSRLDSVNLQGMVFDENTIYTVYYEPTEVNYTVDIYFQNIENDDYSFYDSRTYSGLTGSKVPLDTYEFDGMRELLHETPAIAADGSTHLEIYYDRLYFMTRVYLDGGYGIYSVYARYQADLQSHLTAPSRAGYSFIGWDEYKVDSDDDGVPDTGGDGFSDTVHPTVPAENLAYVALWKENPTARVNVVFWGQDPNDDDAYDYLETKQMQVAPGTELTYDLTLDGENYPCGLEEHTHDEDCVTKCGKEVHPNHTAECYQFTCTSEEHAHVDSCYSGCSTHTHSLSCYTTSSLEIANDNNLSNYEEAARDRLIGFLEDSNTEPVNGNVYGCRRNNTNGNLYVFFYFNGTWYFLGNENSDSISNTRNDRYSGIKFNNLQRPAQYSSPGYTTVAATNTCGAENHTHTEDCNRTCGKEEHSHTDYTGSCYTLTCTTPLHTHEPACYECQEHSHTAADCGYPTFKSYDAALWYLSTKEGIQETITVERDGSSVLNVYFDRTTFTLTFRDNGSTVATITDKWGASIYEEFMKAPFSTDYNGYPWTCTETSKYSHALQTLDVMPKFNATFNLKDKSSNTKKTIYYYVQVPGTTVNKNQWPENQNNFVLLKQVDTYFNYATYEEEYHEMVGYSRYSKQLSGFTGSNSRKDFTDNRLDLYYLSTDYTLEFYSGNDVVRTTVVPYKYSLSEFAVYTDPPLPSNVEAGSHEFKGWYLNPECTRKADLATMTMPAGNLALYAKWEPKYHDVRIVLEKKDDGVYGPEDSVLWQGDTKLEKLSVLHGTIIFSGNQDKTPPIPDNGDYHFLGWFYEDDGVELMWDFEHHPVVKELVIYAKWSSEVLVPYTIRYKFVDPNTHVETEIAEPTTGSSLAGHSITLKAKVGNELAASYRDGYFPQTSSHSIELKLEDAEDGVEYTFLYDKADPQPYWVHYVEKGNPSNELITAKSAQTSYAVVTEKFEEIEIAGQRYTPDALQKTLIITTNPAENHLYFYYTKSDNDGVWLVEHFAENRDHDGLYDALPSAQGQDKLGTVISASWPVDLSTDGFVFERAVINDGSEVKTVDSLAEAKGSVTEAGLHIQVYYKRIKYPFKIVFINKDTGNKILEEQVFTAEDAKRPYGKKLYPSDILGVDIPHVEGYVYDSQSSCTIVKDGPDAEDITKNVMYVYYTENYVKIFFVAIGEGSVPESLSLKFESDKTATVKAVPAPGHRFVGWYYDVDCTNPIVETDTLVPDGMNLILKRGTGWAPATYYAKFEPGTATMTIRRQNAEVGQVYVYEVKNTESGEIIYVTVVGNSETSIQNLPLGQYTVTQQNDWSWRHEDAAKPVVHENLGGTTVIFGDVATEDQWLNGNSSVVANRRG
ncbi:MAG: InlB B-repeat-containing protein [Clostridia bacterium]|nr:InlB B-repeat-containing protein [Clostridia bacterium]